MALASTVLMVRPSAFGFNAETAVNNFFQSPAAISHEQIQSQAVEEFDNMVELLRDKGIEVIVIPDTDEPPKPDAIFPNNWLSTSPNGILSVYPLFAHNRRAEKRDDILKLLNDEYNINALQDWTEFEVEGRYLEGTGSMVIDHDNKMIYASASERTSVPLLEKFAAAHQYQAIVFLATDEDGRPIYHTNVMMSLGEEFALLCEEAIEEEWELIAVRQILESTNHQIIPISRAQMRSFAGNILQVKNGDDEKFIVVSQSAMDAFKKEQREMLEAYGEMIVVPVPTIEQIEGGSVRCMMAEIFLEKKVKAANKSRDF
jgi:hypothetical protein